MRQKCDSVVEEKHFAGKFQIQFLPLHGPLRFVRSTPRTPKFKSINSSDFLWV